MSHWGNLCVPYQWMYIPMGQMGQFQVEKTIQGKGISPLYVLQFQYKLEALFTWILNFQWGTLNTSLIICPFGGLEYNTRPSYEVPPLFCQYNQKSWTVLQLRKTTVLLWCYVLHCLPYKAAVDTTQDRFLHYLLLYETVLYKIFVQPVYSIILALRFCTFIRRYKYTLGNWSLYHFYFYLGNCLIIQNNTGEHYCVSQFTKIVFELHCMRFVLYHNTLKANALFCKTIMTSV